MTKKNISCLLTNFQEHMLVCESSQKPLMFFHLVFHLNVTGALVFTKSSESTARLVRLFDFFQKWRAAESGKSLVVQAYSSDLSVGERKVILERFKAQEINMYILLFHSLVSFMLKLCPALSVPISFQEGLISVMFHTSSVMMFLSICGSTCIGWDGQQELEGVVTHGH